jgi:hypothetical protein
VVIDGTFISSDQIERLLPHDSLCPKPRYVIIPAKLGRTGPSTTLHAAAGLAGEQRMRTYADHDFNSDIVSVWLSVLRGLQVE